MKNLTSQLTALELGTSIRKRDFIIKTVSDCILSDQEKGAFIQNISTPIKASTPDDRMLGLLDGIAGYYIYLYNNNAKTWRADFLKNAMHDLYGYLKGVDGVEDFAFITKNYSCYLK